GCKYGVRRWTATYYLDYYCNNNNRRIITILVSPTVYSTHNDDRGRERLGKRLQWYKYSLFLGPSLSFVQSFHAVELFLIVSRGGNDSIRHLPYFHPNF